MSQRVATCPWNESFQLPVPLQESSRSLLDFQELYLEGQLGIGWDGAGKPALAIAEFRRNHQFALAPGFHADDAFIPALDDLAAAQLEAERLAAIQAAIELLTIVEPA